MDSKEAIARAVSWRDNPRSRPQPEMARTVAGALVNRIEVLEKELSVARTFAIGQTVIINRGNPNRGPESGPSYGRDVKAVIIGFGECWHEIRCRLAQDDPDAVPPSSEGAEGFWSVTQVRLATQGSAGHL